MTNAAAITPIRRRVNISIVDAVKEQIKEKKYINRTTKYIIVK